LPFVFGSLDGDAVQKVDTTDVALLSRFFRYGLLFVFLYLVFIIKSLKICNNNDLLESQVYMLMMICYFGWAICGDVFYQASIFMPVLCMMPYLLNKRCIDFK